MSKFYLHSLVLPAGQRVKGLSNYEVCLADPFAVVGGVGFMDTGVAGSETSRVLPASLVPLSGGTNGAVYASGDGVIPAAFDGLPYAVEEHLARGGRNVMVSFERTVHMLYVVTLSSLPPAVLRCNSLDFFG